MWHVAGGPLSGTSPPPPSSTPKASHSYGNGSHGARPNHISRDHDGVRVQACRVLPWGARGNDHILSVQRFVTEFLAVFDMMHQEAEAGEAQLSGGLHSFDVIAFDLSKNDGISLRFPEQSDSDDSFAALL